MKHRNNMKKLAKLYGRFPYEIKVIVKHLIRIEIYMTNMFGGMPTDKTIFGLKSEIFSMLSDYVSIIAIHNPEKIKDLSNNVKIINSFIETKYSSAWSRALTENKPHQLLIYQSFLYNHIVTPLLNTIFTLEERLNRAAMEGFVASSVPRFDIMKEQVDEVRRML